MCFFGLYYFLHLFTFFMCTVYLFVFMLFFLDLNSVLFVFTNCQFILWTSEPSPMSILFYIVNQIIAQIISIIKIAGKPITNLIFLVLCLNNCIPSIPSYSSDRNNTNTNKVDSLTLQLPFLAFCLSIYIAINDNKFIINK